MAILSNLTVNTTGGLKLPSGPESARPACRIETFTSSGTTTWTAPSWVTSVEVLVVGGGGGGGWDVGGGGGAGGLVYEPNFAVTPGTSYTVTVGAGGAGANANNIGRAGLSGSNSVFGTITAYGGGGAGGWSAQPAKAGGSGGGQTSNTAQYIQAPGYPGQGFPGGRSANNTGNINNYSGAGGGGGAGGPGGDGIREAWEAYSNKFGYGGPGLGFAISGQMQYYAGGGAGAADSSTFWGAGGLGGGGSIEQNGTANTGGGGGGGSLPTNIGGTGGSGVVIIKYHDPRVLIFSDVGTTTWTCPAGVTSLEVLCVAGGGGGGAGTAGGGGGGGVVYYGPETPRTAASFSVTPGTAYTVTVGAGGAGGAFNTNNNGSNGGNSVFGSITALGGGGGGGDGSAGLNGGSGGGSYTATAGTGSQGFAGGRGPGAAPYGSGGGGGAGGAGTSTNVSQNNGGTRTQASGGAGGIGRLTRITGHYLWVAGGGAGAGYSTSAQGGSEAYGGRGGGGNGTQYGDTDITHHLVGTTFSRFTGMNGLGGGGGGGGESRWPPNVSNGRISTNSSGNSGGARGGDGVVIIKASTPLLTDPDIVNGSLNGYLYYNTTRKVPELYSKGCFRDASIADLDGTRPELAAPSAAHIKRLLGEAATSGYYWINIRGIPTLTYCEMDLADGGWMLGMNINTSDGSIVHFANNNFWQSSTELTSFPNNTRPTSNPFQCFRRDYKALEGGNLWANYPGTQIMIVVHESDGQNYFGWRSWNINTKAVTKFSQFWNGTTYLGTVGHAYRVKITDGSTGYAHSGPAGSLSNRTPNVFEPDDLVANGSNSSADSNRVTQVNPNASLGFNKSSGGYSRGDNSGAGFGTYYDTNAGGRPESDAQNWDSGTWVNSGGGYYGSDTLNNGNFSSWNGKSNTGGGGDTYNWQNFNGLNYDFAIYIK